MAAGFVKALTRENSVPGQLTRKGISSLSWGSARPPPDASRRPQRTSNTGPPGTRLRTPPSPSSILRRRFLQPPPQPPLLSEETRRRRRRRRRRRDYKASREQGTQPPPRLLPESPAKRSPPPQASRHHFRGRRHINIRGHSAIRLRKPGRRVFLVCGNFSPAVGIRCDGLLGRPTVGVGFSAEKCPRGEPVSCLGASRSVSGRVSGGLARVALRTGSEKRQWLSFLLTCLSTAFFEAFLRYFSQLLADAGRLASSVCPCLGTRSEDLRPRCKDTAALQASLAGPGVFASHVRVCVWWRKLVSFVTCGSGPGVST
jgi:hypothetical protein